MKRNLKFLAQSAVIAALYVALTLASSPLTFGSVSLRISEALTVLPFIFPSAIAGLTVGCVISNMWSHLGLLDIIIGSLATLVASVLTYWCSKLSYGKYLAPLPPVVANAIGVGFTISVVTFPAGGGNFLIFFLTNALWVALSQLLSCYGLGLPLLIMLDKNRKIFNRYI